MDACITRTRAPFSGFPSRVCTGLKPWVGRAAVAVSRSCTRGTWRYRVEGDVIASFYDARARSPVRSTARRINCTGGLSPP